jgi:hypothetical protein
MNTPPNHGTQEWFDSLDLRTPTQKPTKKVLVTLHGGCFVGGSSEWDQPQTEFLRQLNPEQLHVYQLEFKKDNLITTLQDKGVYAKNKIIKLKHIAEWIKQSISTTQRKVSKV